LSEEDDLPSTNACEVKGEDNFVEELQKETFDPVEELRRLKVCCPATVLTSQGIVSDLEKKVKRERKVPVVFEEIEDTSVPGSKKRKIEVIDLT
jgi:hypothetical protein